MTDQLTISTLTLRHRIPDGWAADPWAEVRPLIDGVDVLREVHPGGLVPSCRHWTGPAGNWPLAVTREPRRIMITEPTCTAGCCGALYVTLRREGDRVIWDAWENTSDIAALPADITFDAAQYEAELARAAVDRSWEEPVDTFARLIPKDLLGGEEILEFTGGRQRGGLGCDLVGICRVAGSVACLFDQVPELTSPVTASRPTVHQVAARTAPRRGSGAPDHERADPHGEPSCSDVVGAGPRQSAQRAGGTGRNRAVRARRAPHADAGAGQFRHRSGRPGGTSGSPPREP